MDITQTQSWRELEALTGRMRNTHLRDLFATDPARAKRYSLELPSFLLDYSKNLVDDGVFVNLLQLAREAEVERWRDRMFSGVPINRTEGRPVLHPALRGSVAGEVSWNGEAVAAAVEAELHRLKGFVNLLHNGGLSGCTGKPVTDVVNLGVGGSHLGPQMVIEALREFRKGGVDVHFVSNVDGAQLTDVLQRLDPETTLFLVSSKTFSTLETLTNAQSALEWLQPLGAREELLRRHFVAVTASPERARAFGIEADKTFRFWDWVGGRFSVWSAIGLPVAIAVGFDGFRALLDGAAEMDRHFQQAPLEENAPVLMALLSVWYCTFMGYPAHAVLPYDQALHMLPAYLQQAEMESNGKSTTRAGEEAAYATGPLIWGQLGINGQHAFYQYLHQSPAIVPADFVGSVAPGHELEGHHEILLANMLAQSQALMNGVSREEVVAELTSRGLDQAEVAAMAPFKVHRGSRPSNTILMKKLTPHSLGALIALYEHKIFVQGVILQIYSFDQWGVELGKGLAAALQPKLESGDLREEDASTARLIEYYRQAKAGAAKAEFAG
ncbi:glucose-6-phosphate isomerase [Microbulbifer flavimaris]|uniref:Glucose-6-phosphate isomerase n=1 Tax=Microbulbifer flavimaris TaxID=1781068 RepID=A0ABX4I009_9GAMM|nr:MULTISPECIES: glucose-6-phosphate isomerase [Microbulbifer]KUJ83300.1 glucose-6-phosphate isomerase [Microbulbifer sp. ZGT114]PCO05451.1 glucose-6-phosphate isomerase [Microbulbifer flavimaris]